MIQEQERQVIERRERSIDESLKETFPASDPPSFVGAGAPKPTGDKTTIDESDLDRVNIRDSYALEGARIGAARPLNSRKPFKMLA